MSSDSAAATTARGVLQVVRAPGAAGQELIGLTLESLFPLSRFLGKQRVVAVDAQLAVFEERELDTLCELSKNVPYLVPLEPALVPIDPELQNKYSGKVILMQFRLPPADCFPDRHVMCENFKNSFIIVNSPSFIATDFNIHYGNKFQGFDDCAFLTHSEVSSTNFTKLYQHLQRHGNRSSLLYANFETAEHPAHAIFSNPFSSLFFQVLPGLLCFFIAQLAMRALVARAKRYSKDQWHSALSHVVLATTMMILCVFFFLDGFGTIGNFGVPTSNMNKQAFSLSRVGINLALTSTWLDLSSQLDATRSSTLSIKSKQHLALRVGFVLFVFLELPVSYFLLQPATTKLFVLSVPAMLLLSESIVGSFFIVSSTRVIYQLGKSPNLRNHNIIRHASILILLSGCNSVLNVVFFIMLTINLQQVLGSPTLYMVYFGFGIYFRLIDAAAQAFMLKPPKQNVFPINVGPSFWASIDKLKPSLSPERKIVPASLPSPGKPAIPPQDQSRWQTVVL